MFVKRLLLVFVLFLSFSLPCLADINIPQSCRVDNFGPGYCCWCSLEMLGRYHGVKKLYDLAKKRSELPAYVKIEYSSGHYVKEKRNVGTDYGVYRKLNSLGVKFRMQWTGNYNHDIIKYAMRHELGCCFAVKSGAFGPKTSAHAMVMVAFNSKTIECIDPNDINTTYVYGRDWFDRYWTGWVCVIEKR